MALKSLISFYLIFAQIYIEMHDLSRSFISVHSSPTFHLPLTSATLLESQNHSMILEFLACFPVLLQNITIDK